MGSKQKYLIWKNISFAFIKSDFRLPTVDLHR